MKRAAANKKTTTVDDDLQRLARSPAAKTQFITSTLDLSWKLALSFLTPLLAGIAIDKKFNTMPSYTFAGLTIAAAFAGSTIYKTFQDVNEEQAKQSKEEKRKKIG
jgi:hypothetical protein